MVPKAVLSCKKEVIDLACELGANIASSNGNAKAKELKDLIIEEMTPSQIEKAQDLARECVKKEYKGC